MLIKRATLEQICRDFIKNRDEIRRIFKRENEQIVSASVFTFLNRGIFVDVAKLEEGKKTLKNNTGVFSNFRGNVQMAMVAQLAISVKIKWLPVQQTQPLNLNRNSSAKERI